MTARTAVLERANAASQNNASSQNADSIDTSPSRSRRGQHGATNAILSSHNHVRATWTGKLLVITGLSPDQFPVDDGSGSLDPSPTKPASLRRSNLKALGASKPATRTGTPREGLKRKRSSMSDFPNGSQADDLTPSDGSQRTSQQGSPSDKDSLAGHRDDDDDQDSPSGDQPHLDGVAEDQSIVPARRKRRRRGQKLLEQSLAASLAPSPPMSPVSEELDKLQSIDLPAAFRSRTPTPDPDDPNDEASAIYRDIYEPLPKADTFLAAMTKINPAQRRTENLYQLAVNVATALRIWQDEYLEIDRRTAPHAPIPRRPATGNRQPLSPTLFEDQKEADIYDYVFDAKKLGHQNPIAQKIIRDASGRELRQRALKGRVGADSQLVNAANTMSEDDGGRRSRARRPVSKYDGVAVEGGRRKRGIGQVTDTIEVETTAKRGRWGGRGGRGRGRGGRGGSGLLAKRIREMREASAVTATSADDDSASENGASDSFSRDASYAPGGDYDLHGQQEYDELGDQGDAGKRKGRPKGSKNLHFRSDKGIPKGPRQPKAGEADPNSPTKASFVSVDASTPKTTPNTAQRSGPAGRPKPKSEKRSESMTAWWAKRKAAAAEKKRLEAEAAGKALGPAAAAPADAKTKGGDRINTKPETKTAVKGTHHFATNATGSSVPLQPLVPAGGGYSRPQMYSNGPPPPNSHSLPPATHHSPHLQQSQAPQMPHYAQHASLPPYPSSQAPPPPGSQYHSPHRPSAAFPLPPMASASPQPRHSMPTYKNSDQTGPPPPPQLMGPGQGMYHDPRFDRGPPPPSYPPHDRGPPPPDHYDPHHRRPDLLGHPPPPPPLGYPPPSSYPPQQQQQQHQGPPGGGGRYLPPYPPPQGQGQYTGGPPPPPGSYGGQDERGRGAPQ